MLPGNVTTTSAQDALPNARSIAEGVDARRALTGFERVLAVGGFPLLITTSVGAAIFVISLGSDPNLATGAMILVAYVAIAVSERLWPWHRSWLHSQGDLQTDIGLAVTNGVIGGALAPVMLAAVATFGAALSERVGIGLWPESWSLLAQLALALVIAELVEYSLHRTMHEVPFMWRFHATHHSAPRLYWLNAARFHPIDLFLVGAVKMVPLALLGAGLPIFALVNLFSAVHGAYQHANLPVRLGWLNWIFSMTELHRWHHSRHIQESNHNYGGNLAIWDVIFRTRYLPTDREPPERIGIEALPRFPMGFLWNLAAPFRWQRLTAAAAPVGERSRPGSR
jgi:sterol desaturase/sphingolipid hydroxylase (fatty acid hydroxylase superfamily)